MVRIGEMQKKKIWEKTVIDMLENKNNNFLEKTFSKEKGRGVKTTKDIVKGEIVTEYVGELIPLKEAKLREQIYTKKNMTESYTIYFKYKEKICAIDAQSETNETMGRLINHSKKRNNLKPIVFEHNGVPKVILIAKKDIAKNSELLFDYGERNKNITP